MLSPERSLGRPLSSLAFVCGLLCAADARAQTHLTQRDCDLVVVKPTPAMNSGIGLDGADPLAPGSYHVAFLLDANFGLLALKLGSDKLGDLVPFRLDAHLNGSYQLLS